MTLQLKYDIKDEVWFLEKDGKSGNIKPLKGVVTGINFAKDKQGMTLGYVVEYDRHVTTYGRENGGQSFPETSLFASKEELIQSL